MGALVKTKFKSSRLIQNLKPLLPQVEDVMTNIQTDATPPQDHVIKYTRI